MKVLQSGGQCPPFLNFLALSEKSEPEPSEQIQKSLVVMNELVKALITLVHPQTH